MEYELTVNQEQRRVSTIWGSSVTDESLMEYQKTVWSDATLHGFDEVIDFRKVDEIKVTTNGLRAVATLAAAMDEPGTKSRFAVVVGNPLSFGLARMYETFRGLDDRATRDVAVFEDLAPALAWLDEER
ncbi:MAG: hypothetical protein JSW51_11165 [Gemmatimonadota bacterium]|nr:MAG: hypothetical protein JSW51_11165 [Gemmatimonadota bacterium]